MARPLAIALLVTIAACGDPPPLTVRFRVTSGDAAACYNTATPPQQVTSCADVTMLCAAVVSIRVVSTDPNEAALPYINVCQQLTGQQNLCSIAGVDLSEPIQPIPLENLEVQIAVFPLSAVSLDSNMELECPQVVFDETTGFPIAADETCDPTMATTCPVLPAVGGRAFYHPGDSETLVELGCTDLTQLDGPACAAQTISVNATVDDFDTEVSVQSSLADDLTVSIGEPKPMIIDGQTHYVLTALDTAALTRTTGTPPPPVPAWNGNVATMFTATACLEVLENSAQTTATLACESVDPSTLAMSGISGLNGIRLATSTLTDILGAISEPDVTPTVKYLSSDRHNIIVGGTSSSGIFVSQDAPYGTVFSATSSLHTVSGFGGIVDSKVTVVVLQFNTPVGD